MKLIRHPNVIRMYEVRQHFIFLFKTYLPFVLDLFIRLDSLYISSNQIVVLFILWSQSVMLL